MMMVLGSIYTSIYSLGYVQGSNTWLSVRFKGSWFILMLCCIHFFFVIILAIVYTTALNIESEIVSAFKDAWFVYIIGLVACLGLIVMHELGNLGIHKNIKLMQQTFKIYFTTKLGMHSPR